MALPNCGCELSKTTSNRPYKAVYDREKQVITTPREDLFLRSIWLRCLIRCHFGFKVRSLVDLYILQWDNGVQIIYISFGESKDNLSRLASLVV